MAQTFDEITEALTEMRLQFELANKNFEKSLTDINSKLEVIEGDDEVSNALRFYISELKKVIEDRNISLSDKVEEVKIDMSAENMRRDINEVDEFLNSLDSAFIL